MGRLAHLITFFHSGRLSDPSIQLLILSFNLLSIMLVTERLTIGQVTFIFRVVIQILTYGGAFLITYIILASSPRVASFKTHDVVNRVLGKATATEGSARWILNSIRGKNTDPILPTRLIVAISLSLLLGIFSSVSDIGFLGFHSCSVPGPPVQDRPSSITTESLAKNAVQAALVNGTTNISQAKAYRRVFYPIT